MNKRVILSVIIIADIVSGIIDYEHPYLSYERTLAQLASQIGTIDYKKYVDTNDWMFSLNVHKIDYECDSFTYSFHQGETLPQDNELSFYGTCTNGFEDWYDKSKAESMCFVLTRISSEAETFYQNSSYYESFGKRLENGETISYRNNVSINNFTTNYWLNLGILDTDFYLNLDRNGEGDFVSKKYINNQEYYYRYDLKYTDNKLEKFQLRYYSTPRESGYYDYDTGKMNVYQNSNSSSDSNIGASANATSSYGKYNKTDYYNSGRYKDADSFAVDYYEDFYDYEDDEDAYDGAVDYWNEWNDE